MFKHRRNVLNSFHFFLKKTKDVEGFCSELEWNLRRPRKTQES